MLALQLRQQQHVLCETDLRQTAQKYKPQPKWINLQ